MSDPVDLSRLEEALAEWEGLDIIQSTGDEAYGVLLEAARRWDALDSDENVEVAARAWCEINGHFFDSCGFAEQHIDHARAALRAVKEAGR